MTFSLSPVNERVRGMQSRVMVRRLGPVLQTAMSRTDVCPDSTRGSARVVKQLLRSMLGRRGEARLLVTVRGRIVWANGPAKRYFGSRHMCGSLVLDFMSFGAEADGAVNGWAKPQETAPSRPLRVEGIPSQPAWWQPLIWLCISERVWPPLDELTGCENREAMEIALDALEEAGCIALLNLNSFNTFNYEHGHGVGDAVLVVITNRLRAGVGDRGTVFRPGGNEFAVLLPGMDLEESERLLAELLTAVAEPIPIGPGSFANGIKNDSVLTAAGLAAIEPPDALRKLVRASGALLHAKRQRVPYFIHTREWSQVKPSLTEFLDYYLAWLAAVSPEEVWTEVLLVDDCAAEPQQPLPAQEFTDQWTRIVSAVRRDWVNLTFRSCREGVLVVAVEWIPPEEGAENWPPYPISVNFSGKPMQRSR